MSSSWTSRGRWMSADQTETTAPPVKALIEAAGIKRVIYVDDAFAAEADDVVAQLAGMGAEERAALVDGDADQMAQEDLWQELVRDHWEGLEKEDQASLVDQIYSSGTGAVAPKLGFLAVLSRLVPEVEHVGLTLSEWREKKEDLIAELAEKPSLLLFDQDFSHEQAANDEGQKLISELESELSQNGGDGAKPEVFYGLVSNTVKIGEEPARRNAIIAESGIDPMRFVVMSKQNLEGDDERLALRLQTMLLAPIFARLMQEVFAAISEAGTKAVEKAKLMTAEDLQEMVVKSSAEEGVWPADTMLRILEILQREKVRESLRITPEVVNLTERLHSMAEAGPTPEDDDASVGPEDSSEEEWAPAAVEIAHDEIYESAEHVNSLHLPIALGDIFEKNNGARYVLVAQPCDLEVRSNGERAPDLTHLRLAKISLGGDNDRRRFADFELPYFERGKSESAFVKLGRPATVRAAILDCCVLNEDGKARLEIDGDVAPLLLPYWVRRREEIAKLFTGVLASVGELDNMIDTPTKSALLGQLKRDPFPILNLDSSEKSIEWDCRRVGRLCDPWARALLARFSQYYARDAYLHDLAGSANSED